MKLQLVEEIEKESIGIEENSALEANIDASSLPFVFELVTKNLYSDVIGSIIREITSNCFDAHKEISSNEAVIVKKSYSLEDDCYYIHFIDKGIGLSPERFVKIYMNYFSSTKRESNDFIGSFGIGSKSPLAYQDSFYITSVSNGKKYDCIFSRGIKPKLDSLYGYEEINGINYPKGVDTDLPNGTEIKLEIKEGDRYVFINKLQEQLAYFDNVYFAHWEHIENNYRIIEGETFKYRSSFNFQHQFSKNYPIKDEMHIIYGKVYYPINWAQIKRKESIEIPVGIKFDIGELMVTPNREQLRYTEDIILLINNKIDACLKELLEIYNKQNPDILDLKTYLDFRSKRPHINFNNVSHLYIPKKYGVKSFETFSLLPNIYVPNNPFFAYKIDCIIEEKIVDKGTNISVVLNLTNNIYFTKDSSINKFTNASLSGAYLLTKKKVSYKEYCRELKLEIYNKHNAHYLDDNSIRRKIIPKLGKAKLIKEYIDYIHNIVLQNCKIYEEHHPTEEWIKQYKLDNKENNAAYLRRLNKSIIVDIISYGKKEVKIVDLEKYYFVVYGIKSPQDHMLLCDVRNILNSRKSLDKIIQNYYNKKDNKILFIEVAESNIKYLKDLTNKIYVRDIFEHKSFKKAFIDYNTCLKIRNDVFNKLSYHKEGLSDYYSSIYDTLNKFLYKNNSNNVHIINDNVTHLGINKEIESLINELEKFNNYFNKELHILKFINSNIPRNYLRQIIRFCKVPKLNYDLYSLNSLSKKEIKEIEENKQKLIELQKQELINNDLGGIEILESELIETSINEEVLIF